MNGELLFQSIEPDSLLALDANSAWQCYVADIKHSIDEYTEKLEVGHYNKDGTIVMLTDAETWYVRGVLFALRGTLKFIETEHNRIERERENNG